jgi:hypothetical protein
MKPKLILCALVALTLIQTGCAGDASSANTQPGAISLPNAGNSDSPPVTMSGYVDTSATGQVK